MDHFLIYPRTRIHYVLYAIALHSIRRIMIVMFFHCKVQAKKKQEKKKQIQFRSLICEIRSAEVPVYRIFTFQMAFLLPLTMDL